MSVRKASTALARVPVAPRLTDRASPPAEPSTAPLDWQGEVRLVADRASGLSAPRWQERVRIGLLERCLALSASHRAGAHRERPETGRRLLAHIDALAEAGASMEDVAVFAEEADLESPGALWLVTLLAGCLDAGDATEAFEAWVESLDASLFLTYRGVLEIAESLAIQPSPSLRAAARRWVSGRPASQRAIALETMTLDDLSDDLLSELARAESPLVVAALERLLTRAPPNTARSVPARASWLDLEVPALSYQVARARHLLRDPEPLFLLRGRDARAIAALGLHALDVLALAGDGGDQDLALDLTQALPTTPGLLDAMGRAGLPSLLPRLLAEVSSDDFDDDAHRALATMLGPRPTRPSLAAWEQAIAALPRPAEPTRLRGGEPYSLRAVLDEMKRPDLSAPDLRARADEVLVRTGKAACVEWEAFGVSLESAVPELARLARG